MNNIEKHPRSEDGQPEGENSENLPKEDLDDIEIEEEENLEDLPKEDLNDI
ncbi:MAG: hypothetical protein AB1589_28605 [Cyanobacteriota bacterium]